MKSLVASLAAILGANTAADASNWMFVDTSAAGAQVSADVSSLTGGGARWQMWLNFHGGKDAAPGTADVKELMVFDCSTRSTRVMSWASYGPSSNFLQSYVRPSYDSGGWEPAIPDTIGDEVLSMVCKPLPATK